MTKTDARRHYVLYALGFLVLVFIFMIGGASTVLIATLTVGLYAHFMLYRLYLAKPTRSNEMFDSTYIHWFVGLVSWVVFGVWGVSHLTRVNMDHLYYMPLLFPILLSLVAYSVLHEYRQRMNDKTTLMVLVALRPDGELRACEVWRRSGASWGSLLNSLYRLEKKDLITYRADSCSCGGNNPRVQATEKGEKYFTENWGLAPCVPKY